jgi:hypothetical protein
MNTHYASDKTLFDFQSSTESTAWQTVNDDVMGGVSASRFELIDGMAVFRGEVSLENNGGFASVRSSPARHNLTGCGSFVIRLRGDGRRYKFTVRIGSRFDTPLYQCAFATKRGVWEEQRSKHLPESGLPLLTRHLLVHHPSIGAFTGILLVKYPSRSTAENRSSRPPNHWSTQPQQSLKCGVLLPSQTRLWLHSGRIIVVCFRWSKSRSLCESRGGALLC